MQARKEALGPLHGLPVAHKDLLETRGILTTYGSPLYRDFVPTEDDLLVERVRRAAASRSERPTRRNSAPGPRRLTKSSERRSIPTI
jgi:hypothetical protein